MGILRSARFSSSGCHFLKIVFNRLTYFKRKKRELYEKENSSVIHKYQNKNWSPPVGVERRPFRTEARKYNHWATEGLHMTCLENLSVPIRTTMYLY